MFIILSISCIILKFLIYKGQIGLDISFKQLRSYYEKTSVELLCCHVMDLIHRGESKVIKISKLILTIEPGFHYSLIVALYTVHYFLQLFFL